MYIFWQLSLISFSHPISTITMALEHSKMLKNTQSCHTGWVDSKTYFERWIPGPRE